MVTFNRTTENCKNPSLICKHVSWSMPKFNTKYTLHSSPVSVPLSNCLAGLCHNTHDSTKLAFVNVQNRLLLKASHIHYQMKQEEYRKGKEKTKTRTKTSLFIYRLTQQSLRACTYTKQFPYHVFQGPSTFTASIVFIKSHHLSQNIGNKGPNKCPVFLQTQRYILCLPHIAAKT